ncbi:MAG: radical SAM protein, partial [Candidatus Methylomirabilales bacterium]
MTFQVSELFTSIQGEGEVIGMPSHFIRLYRCDLTCSWCDSKYTW